MGIDQIYVTDKLDNRLLSAGSVGAIWTGNPDREDVTQKLASELPPLFDVVIECCGKQEALDQAVEILKPGGLLLAVGIPAHDRISFDMNLMRRKEISIQNVRRQNNTVQSVIDLLAAGNINPEFMITHRFPLEKTQEAFDLVADYRDNVIKAAIEFA
jgi:threonine dehydrogenase-like Zn-dependent dehydrogenase